MDVEMIVTIPGRGPQAVGRLADEVHVGDKVSLRSPDAHVSAMIAEIRLGFDRIPPESAQRGDDVALLLKDVLVESIEGRKWLMYRQGHKDDPSAD